MTMASFLQRMNWRGVDNDRHSMTIAEENWIAESENKEKIFGSKDCLDNRSRSASNIPELVAGPRRPSTLKLFGTSQRLIQNGGTSASGSSDSVDKGSKIPATRLIEEVVREFEETYKSPTEVSTPSKKSKNFVKRLVAALERRQRDNEATEAFAKRNNTNSEPIFSHVDPAPIVEENIEKLNNYKNRKNQASNERGVEATIPKSEMPPKVVGAFLKKPIEIQRTPVYWIPITADKKLPRKKSFKKFLAKLTGRSGGKVSSEGKTKQVVFASQENLIEEIHDSGYEGRSTSSSRASSLTSFTETLMYHDNDYIDKAYRDCNFSTFVTSSPVKKTSPRFAEVEETLKEDSAIFNEDSIPRKDLVSTRVQQISYQLAKLPKHPFAKSEPRLCGRGEEGRGSSEEIVTLRSRRGRDGDDEPVYDVPRARPRSSIFDESLSMRRRNVPIQSVAPLGRSGHPVFSRFENDEEPHYATVRPRCMRNHVSYDNLWRNLAEESMCNPIPKMSTHSHSFADLTADESFVVTMYV